MTSGGDERGLPKPDDAALLRRAGYLPADATCSQQDAHDLKSRRHATWQTVQERITPVQERVAGAPVTSLRRARSRRWVLATAAAACIGLVVALEPWATPPAAAATPPLLTFSVVGQGLDPEAGAAATSELMALAATVASGSQTAAAGTGTGTGQRYIVTSSGWVLESSDPTQESEAAVTLVASRSTVEPDGSMTRTEHWGEHLTPDGRLLPADALSFDRPDEQVDTFVAGSVDLHLMRRLPRDPAQLIPALTASSGCGAGLVDDEASAVRSACLVRYVGDLHQTQLVPDDLEAAIWVALAQDPHLRWLGSGTDRAGRAVEGFSVVADAEGFVERAVVLLDAQTGRYAGSESVALSGAVNGVPAPAVISFTTLLGIEVTTAAP